MENFFYFRIWIVRGLLDWFATPEPLKLDLGGTFFPVFDASSFNVCNAIRDDPFIWNS